MSTLSHHAITVSRNGKHVFTTDSATGHHWTSAYATDLFWLFTAKFPKTDGYDVSMTYWDCSGTPGLTTKND